jgi:hypothetical protein
MKDVRTTECMQRSGLTASSVRLRHLFFSNRCLGCTSEKDARAETKAVFEGSLGKRGMVEPPDIAGTALAATTLEGEFALAKKPVASKPSKKPNDLSPDKPRPGESPQKARRHEW